MDYEEILYDEENDEYSFTCPYCGTKHVLPDDVGCEHIVFGYESINSQPLDMSANLYSAIEKKLLDRRTKGPDLFQDAWYEYDPGSDDREEMAAARQECVDDYLNNRINMEEVEWFLERIPAFNGYEDHASIAEYDDVGGNPISYLLFDDEFLKVE